MSALDDLRTKVKATPLEEAVRLFADYELEARKDGKNIIAELAAAELTAIRERLKKAERLLDEIMQRIEVWDGVPDKIDEWKSQ